MLHLSLQQSHLAATFNVDAQALDCCHPAYVMKQPVCQLTMLLYLKMLKTAQKRRMGADTVTQLAIYQDK